jgi:hypothetical protein
MQLKEGELALIDEVPTTHNQERVGFIERVLNKKVKLYLAKEELMGYPISTLNRILIFISILLHGIFLIPLCIFSRNRVFHALTLYYVIESALVLYFLKNAGIKTVVFSNIYSQDSNINYLLLSQQGIKVIKNPSEDALAFDNSILLSDELIICNPYQVEELDIIKTVKVKSIIHGLPEQINSYEMKYGDTFYPPERKVVGYYSSGSWLRKQYSRYYFHLNIDCAYQEELLLLDLKDFILQNPGYSLRIFQHPVEKKDQQAIDLTNGYFRDILGNVNYTLNDPNLHTCLSFENCDTAISLLSGSSLYRLVFGYKSLFYVPDNSFPTFPFKGTSLDKINAGRKSNFSSFLKEQMDMDENSFFSNYQLEDYRYREIIKKTGVTETFDSLLNKKYNTAKTI